MGVGLEKSSLLVETTWQLCWILPYHLLHWKRNISHATITRSEKALQEATLSTSTSGVKTTWQICWPNLLAKQHLKDWPASTFSGMHWPPKQKTKLELMVKHWSHLSLDTKRTTYMLDYIYILHILGAFTYYQKQETFSQLSFSYLGFIYIYIYLHGFISTEGCMIGWRGVTEMNTVVSHLLCGYRASKELV